ncbi:MAG TPA: TetR/AcrR family transcriptional regulator C-terminal domain-containing protein [Candidatus Limnocylindrales bacterium]|nr:TetR/AcrR family transcriptional regulator C-terminal domain-containing protein [Candidatus Limnocylindrales bacterium]
MELADQHGIASLTMRSLARWLGVEAASLYNHVTGKDDVLDGITDLVVAEIDVPTGAVGWREAMRTRARSAMEVFARHPWASGLIDSRERMGPARLAYVDGVLGVLLRAGFSAEAAANAFMALDSYIYGFERQRTELRLGEGGADPTAAAHSVQMSAPPEAYPALARVAGEFADRPFDVLASFEFGLELILGGLERALTGEGAATSRAAQ